MDSPRFPLVVSAALAVLLAVVLAVALAGGDDAPPPRAVAAGTTPAPPAGAPRPGAAATTPATPASGVPTLPARVPGYTVAPVPIGTARESLVFRTRNAVLNGVSGPASGYAVEIAQATRGETIGVLIGVAARPGVTVPPVPRDIVGLIGRPARLRARVAGHRVAVYPGAGYQLVVVDAGPRRAVVGIATSPAAASALGSAVARGL